MSRIAQAPPSYGGNNGQGAPHMQQPMPMGAQMVGGQQGGYRPPQATYQQPGQGGGPMLADAPPQGAPPPQGMAPPPLGAPPPGGPEQFNQYRQMLQNKGGPEGVKPKHAAAAAQMAYAAQHGRDFDPSGKLSWMDNPNKKQRKQMKKVAALRGQIPPRQQQQAVDPVTGY